MHMFAPLGAFGSRIGRDDVAERAPVPCEIKKVKNLPLDEHALQLEQFNHSFLAPHRTRLAVGRVKVFLTYAMRREVIERNNHVLERNHIF